MARTLVGIDLGTSSVKVVVLTLDGSVLATSQVRYPVSRPRSGWAEQDPERWWTATCRALADAQVDRAEVAAVGLSGQMHGLVAVDDHGVPVRPAIIWSDARSSAQVETWTRLLTPAAVEATTGMPIASGMLGLSLTWVRDAEPDVYDRIATVLSPKDYIRYRLTGVLATEPTDAAGGLLYDIRSQAHASHIIDALGLRHDLLAPVVGSLDIAGEVTADAAGTGLPVGTPVAAGGGDQAMAALALGLTDSRRAAVAISSGGTAFRRTDGPLDPHLGLHVLPSAVPGQWMAMGVVLAAGLAIDWLAGPARRREPTPERIADLMAGAATAGIGARGVLASPHLGGTRTPVADDRVRAALFGLGFEHDDTHIARAIVEGVCISLVDALTAMDHTAQPVREIVLSGGGARFEVWRRTLADVAGLPVHVSADLEHSALGAALAAAHAVGVDVDFTPDARIASIVAPDLEAHRAYRDVAERLRRVTRATDDELRR